MAGELTPAEQLAGMMRRIEDGAFWRASMGWHDGEFVRRRGPGPRDRVFPDAVVCWSECSHNRRGIPPAVRQCLVRHEGGRRSFPGPRPE